MKKQNNKVKILLIIVTVLVCAIGGYLIYDKVLSDKKDENNNHEISNESSYNKEYFVKKLSVFLDHLGSFMDNIDVFDNDHISTYLFYYYSDYANKNELASYDNEGNITYNVSKNEMDALVLETFGISNYEIVNISSRDGIRKIDDNVYQVYWFATGYYTPSYKLSNFSNQNDSTTIEYNVSGNPDMGETDEEKGVVKFVFSKQGNNWVVTKVQYIEKK